VWNINLGII